MKKICTKCKELKPEEQFALNDAQKSGRHTTCKLCRNNANRQYYQKNRKEINQKNNKRSKQYRQEHGDQYRETHRIQSRENYTKHKDEINRRRQMCRAQNKEQARKYYTKHKDKLNKRNREWNQNHQEVAMFHAAKSRAKRNNILFDLKTSDIVIPSHCPLLGIVLSHGSGSMKAGSPSLDRIDPKKGYTRDNIHVISWRANSLKKDATSEELTQIANGMLKIVSERRNMRLA